MLYKTNKQTNKLFLQKKSSKDKHKHKYNIYKPTQIHSKVYLIKLNILQYSTYIFPKAFTKEKENLISSPNQVNGY